MIIDADGQVLGRMSSYAAKKALLGENVIVVNAEKAVVVGKRDEILHQYASRLERKSKSAVTKGPYHQKRPDRFVRKTIRGMLPWNKSRGIEAYKKVMVYIGTPMEVIKEKHSVDIKKEKPVKIGANVREDANFLTVGEICKFIGGSW